MKEEEIPEQEESREEERIHSTLRRMHTLKCPEPSFISGDNTGDIGEESSCVFLKLLMCPVHESHRSYIPFYT